MSAPAANAIFGRKLQSLDGLRAIAIILVLLCHIYGQLPIVNRFTFCLNWYIRQGWVGVDLFFVLSGFLITGILLDTRQAGNYFTGFYARRVLRIFPLYYAVLTAVLVLGTVFKSPRFTETLPISQDRWLYYCYLMNWVGLWKGSWFANCLGHFWSLAIEEQFYLLWPLVVWIARPRAVPWVAVSLASVAILTRLIWVSHSGAQISISLATISRLDELLAGALCACLFRSALIMGRVRKWLPWTAFLGIGSFFLVFSWMLFFPQRAALLLFRSSPGEHTLDDAMMLFAQCGGYVLLALGFGALVLLTAHTDGESTWMQRLLKYPALVRIGIYSYGIYVFHVPILDTAASFVFPRVAQGVQSDAEAIFVCCSYNFLLAIVIFAISALSYEFFEKRILRLKRYFEPEYGLKSQENKLFYSPQQDSNSR